MTQHTITLYGSECKRPQSIGPLLSLLEPAIRDTVRLAFYMSTRIHGRPMRALQQSWQPKLLGIEPSHLDSVQLLFELPCFGEIAPQFYRQDELWDDAPKIDDTGLDLFGYTLIDVASDIKDSNRFDDMILKHISKFRRVLKHGVTKVSLGGHHLSNGHTPPPVEIGLVEMAQKLVEETPGARRVKVQGTLDMIRGIDRAFELILSTGERLRAVWIPDDVSILADYWNRPVLIEGDAIFRPSGRVHYVEAEAIQPAFEKDSFFSRTPEPGVLNLELLHKNTKFTHRKNEFEKIAGAWPGDESIEELLQTLHELGR